jgi:hypothetical protein
MSEPVGMSRDGSSGQPGEAEFLFCSGLIVIGQIAKEQERQHVIAEIVRVHGSAKIVGDFPEGVAKLFLVGFDHGRLFV